MLDLIIIAAAYLLLVGLQKGGMAKPNGVIQTIKVILLIGGSIYAIVWAVGCSQAVLELQESLGELDSNSW